MRTINYESDFKIREQREDGTPMWNAPFRFTYYVKMSRGTFVASYDGREFINCHKGTGEDEGKLIVAFDSPQFGTGVLRVKREFFLNDSDFMDGVRHYVSDESTDVVLDKGATTEGVVVDTVFNPSYYKGDKGDQGDSAYQVWLNAGNDGSIEDFFSFIKGEKGDTGVGIDKVEQTTVSDEDSGLNIIFITMTNGEKYQFKVRNGSKGDKGDTFTYDDLTQEQKEDLAYQVIGEAENERRAAEIVRQENEVTREEQEAKRIETFNTNESQREDAFNVAQSQMAQYFQESQTSRNNTFIANEDSRRDTANASEASRKKTFDANESARQSTFSANEAERQASESGRVTAEGARESAETLRKQAEVDRENTFAANEKSRQDIFTANETSRQNAESVREANEKKREETYKQKVDRDDNAPKLTAGFANNLVGRGEATEEEISFRPSGGDTSIEDGTARIERLKGSTVVWNQYDKSFEYTEHGVTVKSTEDGIYTLNGQATTDNTIYGILRGCKVVSAKNNALEIIEIISGEFEEVNVGPKGIEHFGAFYGFSNRGIFTKIHKYDYSYLKIVFREGDKFTNLKFRANLYDLTKMFGAGNEPTTIEEFNARKPIGIDEYAYNEGELISTNVDEVKSVGFNAWDEEWEVGEYEVYSGQPIDNKKNSIRCKNYIRVVKGGTYEVVNKSNTNIAVIFFDSEYNYVAVNILNTSVKKVTIPLGATYIKFFTANYGGVYKGDICIHLVHTGYRNGEYEPYKEFRRSLPIISEIKDSEGNQLFPNGLLSAGSVYDEITATKAIKRIGVVDLGSLNWFYETTTYPEWPNFYVRLTNKKGGWNNIVCSKYSLAKSIHDRSENKVITGTAYFFNDNVIIRDSAYTDAATFKAAMSGVMLYYELAEPIEVDLEEPLNLDYEVSDFGTEEVISDVPTTPMKADIIYQFNAVDRIRDNSRHTAEAEEKLLDYESRIKALEAIVASLTSSES